MKKNVTLKLDADLVQRARVLAARKGTSISRMMADQLERLVDEDQRYQTARRRALDRLSQAYDLRWRKPKDRGELHDREGLR